MRVLVLGAGGYAGRAVTRALSARGIAVRAFVRRPAYAEPVREDGADEVVVGDLLDLATVGEAARGADGIFFLGPRFLPEEAELGEAVIDIAERVGVRRFVLSGVYHPTIRALRNHQTKRRIEDRLYRSDLAFTVLQPARYLHGLILSAAPRMLDDGVLADPFGPDVPMAYVDYRDVAEVAAIAFAEERLVRGTFELATPGEYSLRDLAAIFGRELGRELRVEQVALDDYGQAAGVLANPYKADGFRRLHAYYRDYGFRGGNGLVLESILGRASTSVGACLRALLCGETRCA